MARALTEKTRLRARTAFLSELAKRGNVSDSVAASGMFSRAWFYNERQRDPEFAAAWDEALETAIDALEREIWRRAVEGTQKPIIGRVGKDEDGVITYVTEYSDSLAALLVKAHRPDKYRERHDVSVQANAIKAYVTISPDDWDETTTE